MKRAEPAAPTRGGKPGDRRDAMPSDRRGSRPADAYGTGEGRSPRGVDRGPRLGDQAFRAQRDAMEHAQLNLKRLASQAHGQALTHLLEAWKARDAAAVPTVADLGSRVAPSTRALWVQALGANSAAADSGALLRLEMAAEVPTPAAHLNARRALQLHLLTRRNDPTPAQTWGKDVAEALSAGWSEESALRMQQALKLLLRRI